MLQCCSVRPSGVVLQMTLRQPALAQNLVSDPPNLPSLASAPALLQVRQRLHVSAAATPGQQEEAFTSSQGGKALKAHAYCRLVGHSELRQLTLQLMMCRWMFCVRYNKRRLNLQAWAVDCVSACPEGEKAVSVPMPHQLDLTLPVRDRL